MLYYDTASDALISSMQPRLNSAGVFPDLDFTNGNIEGGGWCVLQYSHGACEARDAAHLASQGKIHQSPSY